MSNCQDELDEFMNLTGKYVFISSEDHYKFGRIIGRAGFEAYLIQFQPPDAVPEVGIHAELYSLEEMTETWGDNNLRCWTFYDTKEALDTYVKWLETPSETKGPKVVNLKTK